MVCAVRFVESIESNRVQMRDFSPSFHHHTQDTGDKGNIPNVRRKPAFNLNNLVTRI